MKNERVFVRVSLEYARTILARGEGRRVRGFLLGTIGKFLYGKTCLLKVKYAREGDWIIS